MIQPLQPANHLPDPTAFLLSAYGVVNTYTSIEILRRWLFIFNNSLQKKIRIIGFSTDGDSKYLRAMRLVSGFFGSLPHFKFIEHQEAFDLNNMAQWPWFFLRKKQLFLFFQDATHLVTKWRNRLLSSTAQLIVGQQFITIQHVADIIENSNYTKLDHGLNRSDLNPKDRQNYNSCVKLASDNVLSILLDGADTYGTYVYLRLLQMIILAYVEKRTRIEERLQSAWCIVFVCRMSWLQNKQSKSTTASTTTKTNAKSKCFFTKTAYLSVELNAHTLLYIVLLVKQKQLPREALNVYLFNSQSCESMFRNARSLSGTYSTMVNFTAVDFLRRSQKISLLNSIKCNQVSQQDDDNILSFPIHHKHNRNNNLPSLQNLDDMDQLNVEKIISNAFNQAIELTANLGISKLLKERKIFDLNSLSEYVFQELNSSSRMFDYSIETVDDDYDEFNLEEDEDNDKKDIMDSYSDDEEMKNNLFDNQDDENNYNMMTVKSNFSGIKIYDHIEPCRRDAYFRIKINNSQKYVQKQSACWLLTDNSMRLSNDRLSRVIETGRKES
ncbi:unnamed protein product [Rotaria magnacalcarata]|nr:unnamed protein product [Rotaria magnacalcarata]